MNLLFLDIDGVLINARGCIAHDLHDIGQPSRATDVNFDPTSVKLLQRVCEICDLKIFIHSTWWHDGIYDTEYFVAALEKYGWANAPVIGGIDVRGRKNRVNYGLLTFQPERWIILDDACMKEEYGSNMLCINPMEGITFADYAYILTYFGKADKIGCFFF
jgi:hypothetical protein